MMSHNHIFDVTFSWNQRFSIFIQFLYLICVKKLHFQIVRNNQTNITTTILDHLKG